MVELASKRIGPKMSVARPSPPAKLSLTLLPLLSYRLKMLLDPTSVRGSHRTLPPRPFLPLPWSIKTRTTASPNSWPSWLLVATALSSQTCHSVSSFSRRRPLLQPLPPRPPSRPPFQLGLNLRRRFSPHLMYTMAPPRTTL